MGVLELRLVNDEIGQSPVLGPQEVEAFEIGVRDAPASLLVDPKAVREDFAQRAFRVEKQRTLKVHVCEPVLERRLRLLAESERILNRFPDPSVVEAVLARLTQGGIDRRAQQRDEDDIVEMPSLERRVLTVVRESENLAVRFSSSPTPDPEPCIHLRIEPTSTVVAELRPSADSAASR